MSTSLVAREQTLLLIVREDDKTQYHLIGLNLTSMKPLWDLPVLEDVTTSGKLGWINDYMILKTFSGKRGSSYSIFNIKSKKRVSDGKAEAADFVIRDGKVFKESWEIKERKLVFDPENK